MAKKQVKTSAERASRTSWGTDVTMRGIRQYARAVAERFRPDKIILFGSHAYGTPNADSDVDILVIMPARSQPEQAVKIRLALRAPFRMDLLVRTPRTLQRRLASGDSFLHEVMSKGKVLYAKGDARVGEKSGGGTPGFDTIGPSWSGMSAVLLS